VTIRCGLALIVVSPKVFFSVTGKPAPASPDGAAAGPSASLPHAVSAVADSNNAAAAAALRVRRDQDMAVLLSRTATKVSLS
jgi:hypothetical protein